MVVRLLIDLFLNLRGGKVIDRSIPEPCEDDENSKSKEGLNELTPSE